MQDCSNPSELAMELLRSCTKPSIYFFFYFCSTYFYTFSRPEVGKYTPGKQSGASKRGCESRLIMYHMYCNIPINSIEKYIMPLYLLLQNRKSETLCIPSCVYFTKSSTNGVADLPCLWAWNSPGFQVADEGLAWFDVNYELLLE